MKTYFYCLIDTGELYFLGGFDGFNEAELAAETMGLNPIWILDDTAANQWRAVLLKDNHE